MVNLCALISLLVLAVVGLILIGGGAFLYNFIPSAVEKGVREKLRLVNGSETFTGWIAPTLPIYMQFYFFNVTNANDVAKKNAKPILQQVGPYTFREYREKYDMEFARNDSTIIYRQNKWFIYEPFEEDGSLNDTVTIPNVPFNSLAQKTEGKLNFVQKMVINTLVTRFKVSAFVTAEIGELIFDGYEDQFFIMLAEKMKKTLLPNGRFGFFYNQNYTDDGLYEVYTGIDGTQVAEIAAWNENSTLSTWNDEYCDMINGSDGGIFKQFLKREDTIRLFSSDLCRSLYMTFDSDTSVNGIKTFRFSPPFSLMADHTINPDNQCFCEGKDNKFCYLSGVLDISRCKKGSPILVSAPHFYQADVKCLEAVEGLNPNKLEHDTVLDIEPMTGVVMRAARRLQMNLAMRKASHLEPMKRLPEMVFPIFWINESVAISPERAKVFRSKVYLPLQIGQAITYALFALGGFLILCGVICFMACARRTSQPGVVKYYQPTETFQHRPNA